MGADLHRQMNTITTREFGIGNNYIRGYNPLNEFQTMHKVVLDGIFIPLADKTLVVKDFLPTEFTPEVIVRERADGKTSTEVISHILITDVDQSLLYPLNYRTRRFNGRSQVFKSTNSAKYNVPSNVHTLIEVRAVFKNEKSSDIVVDLNDLICARSIDIKVFSIDKRICSIL